VTHDLFLFASLGILKFIPISRRNGRMHRMSRVFFYVSRREMRRQGRGGDEFGDTRGAHDAGFNELFCSPLVPPLKPPL